MFSTVFSGMFSNRERTSTWLDRLNGIAANGASVPLPGTLVISATQKLKVPIAKGLFLKERFPNKKFEENSILRTSLRTLRRLHLSTKRYC